MTPLLYFRSMESSTPELHRRHISLIECPRDAMQGWPVMIPTSRKVAYLNSLLRVGFNCLDFGSFVSAKAIPQMADTREVLLQLSWRQSATALLAIVANLRGAEEACRFEAIRYLGFPFSLSETFQQRNTHSSIAESLDRVQAIHDLCVRSGKGLVVYLSMGFGNPYGDPFSDHILYGWVSRLRALGIRIFSLADTVGLASPEQVYQMTGYLCRHAGEAEIGVHLHARPGAWQQKVDAALRAGCLRFDGALKGIGGCPMAGDDLVGNVDTLQLIEYFESLNLLSGLDKEALGHSVELAADLFGR